MRLRPATWRAIGLAAAVMAGGAAPVYDTWKQGASRGIVYDATVATSGDSKRGFKFRRMQTVLCHGTKMRLGFMGYRDPGTADLVAVADVTWTKVSVEIGGVVKPANFSASRSGTVTGVVFWTDELDAADFNLTDFYGQTVWTSGMGTVASLAAIPAATGETYAAGALFTGEKYVRYDPANAIDDIDTPGAKATPTGGVLGNVAPFNNFLQIKTTAAQKSIVGYGDSKPWGSNDFFGDGLTANSVGVVGGGHIRRAAMTAGVPYFMFAIGGATMTAYTVAHTLADQLLAAGGFTDCYSDRLVNDVFGSFTLAQCQTRAGNFYDGCRAAGISRVYQISVASETNASSTYRDTTAGQQSTRSAPFNVGGIRDQLNTWLAAGAGGKLDGFVDIHSTLYDPATNFWNLLGRTYTLAANTTAFAQTLSLTTAPFAVGEQICFGAGTANNVVVTVRGWTGTGPYTVTLNDSFSTPTFLSGDTGLATPTKDGVHEGPVQHATEGAIIAAHITAH